MPVALYSVWSCSSGDVLVMTNWVHYKMSDNLQTTQCVFLLMITCWFWLKFPWNWHIVNKISTLHLVMPHCCLGMIQTNDGQANLNICRAQWVKLHAGVYIHPWGLVFNTLRPRQNGRHFPDDIFKCIFLNENEWIPIKISLKLVPKCQINIIPSFFQIMAWHRPGNKPLSEAMMVS